MRRWAIGGALVVLVLGALFVVRPFMAAERDYPAEIPSPSAIVATDSVPLVRGQPACFSYAVVEAHSEQARFKVVSPHGPAPALRLSMVGPGYRYAATVPAGTLDSQVVQIPVPASPAATPLRVCFSNLGARPIALSASNDRTRSRSHAIVDGRDTDRSIWFGLYETAPHAITERLPATVQRMTIFRPAYVTKGVVWALLFLFLLGVPAAVVWAYARAVRDDERAAAAAEPFDVNQRRSWWRRLVG
jgi:hypothetical protein